MLFNIKIGVDTRVKDKIFKDIHTLRQVIINIANHSGSSVWEVHAEGKY